MSVTTHSVQNWDTKKWEADLKKLDGWQKAKESAIDQDPSLSYSQKRHLKKIVAEAFSSIITDFLVLTAGLPYDKLLQSEAERRFSNSSAEIDKKIHAALLLEKKAAAKERQLEEHSSKLIAKIHGLKPSSRQAFLDTRQKKLETTLKKPDSEGVFVFPSRDAIERCLNEEPVIGTYYREKGVVGALAEKFALQAKVYNGIALGTLDVMEDNKSLDPRSARMGHLMLTKALARCAIDQSAEPF